MIPSITWSDHVWSCNATVYQIDKWHLQDTIPLRRLYSLPIHGMVEWSYPLLLKPILTNMTKKFNSPRHVRQTVIIIPTRFNDSHWITLVLWELDNRVLFLYADGMNNQNSKQELKDFMTKWTNVKFCTPNAEWINCKNTFYTPHSNECGPQTLLSIHIMATHPNPDSNILLHLMHQNLSQISRVWIPISIVTEKIHDTTFINHSRAQN